MWALYMEILTLTIGLSSFIVISLATVTGHSLHSRDLLVPAAIQFLLVSLVFILRALVRLHDAKVVARALGGGTSVRHAGFKEALVSSTADKHNFSRGSRTWNS